MRIEVGGFTIEVEIKRQINDVLDIQLRDLIESGIKISARQSNGPTEVLKPNTHDGSKKDSSKEIGILNEAGITSQTLSMVSSKVLGIKTDGKKLANQFTEIQKGAAQFLQRTVPSDIWALYIAPVDLAELGVMTTAVGLSAKNQLTILALSPETPNELFKSLISRGLKQKALKLGVLSFHVGAIEEFKTNFPNAQVALDWQEFIEMALGAATKVRLKAAMLNPNKKEVNKIISDEEGPKELLTYLNYPKNLWRALRTTAAIKRIETDLKKKIRVKSADTVAHKQMIIQWALMRLQYHWNKIPVDAEQLSNLKYIQSEQTADLE